MHVCTYNPSYREAVEDIHFETGFLGSSMHTLLTNNIIWKKQITYYLDQETNSIFVFFFNKKIVGYILGCLDDKKIPFKHHFVLSTLTHACSSIFLPTKDRIFWFSQLKSLWYTLIGLSGERYFKTPPRSDHIHINLLPEARSKGYGSTLLQTFEQYARQQGVSTIHADSFETPSTSNTHFWLKNGYTVYCKVNTSLWKSQLPHQNIHLVCYIKQL
ncbi:MAG: GNAT family N-acetyltransferase [Candidatus Woesearchaeota archaeon]